MALVSVDDQQGQIQIPTSKSNKKVGATKGTEDYPLNYEKLRAILEIEGLKGDKDVKSTPEAHRAFMSQIRNIFIKPGKANATPIVELAKRTQSIPSNKMTGPTAARSNTVTMAELDNEESTDPHDVRNWTKHLRKHRKEEADIELKTDGIRILRKLLRKLPFQRTAEDIGVMYKVLKTFPQFANMVSSKVLRELCFVAQIDVWKEEDFPVFGSSGMHMVLKGSVKSQSFPHIYSPKSPIQDFKNEFMSNKHSLDGHTSQLEMAHHWDKAICAITEESVPEQEYQKSNLAAPNNSKSNARSGKNKLVRVGECFGTFVAIDGQTMHKQMLMMQTSEPNCEFMKITTSDYSRVIEQIKTKEQTKKLNLIQACPPFKHWTRQPKLKLAGLLEWQEFAPNTVIVSEGYKAPFIGFILKGECHVLKQLEVLNALPNGEQERKVRQVVMGKLGVDQSFAELSLLNEEPMTCSIITCTDVVLGTISPEDLYSLDETTLELLQQSCQPTFDSLTQDQIQEEYMDQEIKREWNQYRHNAVIEAINAQGIRPGYGKWRKN